MHSPAPVLLIVAHGSRDPRHAATVSALADRVRCSRPGLRVEIGYLDLTEPTVPEVLAELDAGEATPVVALPLLVNRAFHAKSDVPAVLREATSRHPGLAVHQAAVLGPDALLLAALERRLAEAGLRPEDRSSTGVVLASAGSSDLEAIAVIARTAREWRHAGGWCAVRPAFVSASLPRVADAVRDLRTGGVRRVAVAQYVLAPGYLPSRIEQGAREAGADLLAPVLGDAPEVAQLLLLRYDQARSRLSAGAGTWAHGQPTSRDRGPHPASLGA